MSGATTTTGPGGGVFLVLPGGDATRFQAEGYGMARGPQGEAVELGTATVTLDGSGDGSVAVSFTETFVETPSILVVPPRADSGTYSATSTSKTGFTVTVASSDLTSRDVKVTWTVVDKG